MPILNTILASPNNINELKVRPNVERNLLHDSVFFNFMRYATAKWHYNASSTFGGEHLLAGTATSVPCGGIATALKTVFIQGAGIPAHDLEYITISGYVWTAWDYPCFDPTVKGNIFTPGDRSYHHGTIFSQHFYLRCGNKFYDPCLNRSYLARDQAVKERLKKAYEIGTGGNRRKVLVSTLANVLFIYQRDIVAQGFQGSWLMVPATKKDLEKALGAKEYNTELAVRGGQTEFAKFASTLQ